MKIGVYNHKSVVDFSTVSDYLKGLMEEFRKSHEKEAARKRIPLRREFFEERLSSLKERLEKLTDYDFLDNLTETLRAFAALDECPEDMRKLFYREHEVKTFSGAIMKRWRRIYDPPRIFDSRMIPEVKDVVSVGKERLEEKKVLFDVVSIKKVGISAFAKCLKDIPPLSERMEILKEKQQFSQRYVYRPYPLAVSLFLEDEASVTVTPDLKSFLAGAVRYISSGEWRTSIVLSAITVESILADLYEEEYKKPAPDVPLGDLFRQVKEKLSLPSEIQNAITTTNEARIAAVHRSRLPVSAREAINALFGATNLTLWHSMQS
jgi:hypothetical protein